MNCPTPHINAKLGDFGKTVLMPGDPLRAKYIAEKLGVELEIKAMEFTTVLASVDLGQADLAISGFGWKEDREQSYELSIGYNQTGEAACHGLMVKADVAYVKTGTWGAPRAPETAQVQLLREALPDCIRIKVAPFDGTLADLEAFLQAGADCFGVTPDRAEALWKEAE